MPDQLTTAEMRARLELMKSEAVAYKRVHMPHVFFQVDEAIEALDLAFEALARREREEEISARRADALSLARAILSSDASELDKERALEILTESPVTDGEAG